MNPLDVAHTYFAAWNQRDPAAIVATMSGNSPTGKAVALVPGPHREAMQVFFGSDFAEGGIS